MNPEYQFNNNYNEFYNLSNNQKSYTGIYNPGNLYGVSGNMDNLNEKNNINSNGIDDDIPLLEGKIFIFNFYRIGNRY